VFAPGKGIVFGENTAVYSKPANAAAAISLKSTRHYLRPDAPIMFTILLKPLLINMLINLLTNLIVKLPNAC
jgi:hypothetical protein